jgi:hypothetical protein
VKLAGTAVLGLTVLLGTLLKPDLPEMAGDRGHDHAHSHAHEPSHPDPSDAGHQHGDADDHHDAPNTPCHHHDTHSCSGHGSVHLMATDHGALNSVSWQRFVSADLVASSDISSKKQFHVPLA